MIADNEANQIVPSAWALRPIETAAWVDQNATVLNGQGIDAARFRRGIVFFSIYDSGSSISSVKNLSSELPPHLKHLIPQNRVNFAARQEWHLNQDIPAKVWRLLTESYRHTADSWEDPAVVKKAFEPWSDARAELEKNDQVRADIEYYNLTNPKVEQAMVDSAPKLP